MTTKTATNNTTTTRRFSTTNTMVKELEIFHINHDDERMKRETTTYIQSYCLPSYRFETLKMVVNLPLLLSCSCCLLFLLLLSPRKLPLLQYDPFAFGCIIAVYSACGVLLKDYSYLYFVLDYCLFVSGYVNVPFKSENYLLLFIISGKEDEKTSTNQQSSLKIPPLFFLIVLFFIDRIDRSDTNYNLC